MADGFKSDGSGADSSTLDESEDRDAREIELGPILLYDGDCGVCAASVQWILSHEKTHELRFAALQSPLGKRLRREGNVGEQIDSVLWVEKDKSGHTVVRMHSAAVATVLNYAGGGWRWLSKIMRIVPAALLDFFYRRFASIRTRVVAPSCLVPTPQQRARFLA